MDLAPGGTIVVTSILILLLVILGKKVALKMVQSRGGSAMNISRAWEILKENGYKNR